MLPPKSVFKTLCIAAVLVAAGAVAVLAPSSAYAITESGETGPGERPGSEALTIDTLFSMSEAGLKFVANNPRRYQLQDQLLAGRHLQTLTTALIHTPNKTRRIFVRLERAKSNLERQLIVERQLWRDYKRASRLDYLIQVRGAELRKKGYLVNDRAIGTFGQKSSDPEVQDLYRLRDQYTSQRAFNQLLRALSWQLSQRR